MERALTDFVRALRAADVRVSTAETLDAFRAAETIGWRDRQRLKEALGAALSKSAPEDVAFDACFERFFRFDAFERAPEGESADSSDDRQNPDNDGESGPADTAPPGEGQSSGGGSGGERSEPAPDERGSEGTRTNAVDIGSRRTSAPASSLGRLLMANDGTALSMAISRAARAQRVEDIRFFTQQGVYTRRILEAMGHPDLVDEIAGLGRSDQPPDRRLGEALRGRRDRLREQIRDYVEQQFLLHADAGGERLREEMLRKTRLANVPRRNDDLMRRVIQRMARQLVAAHSRKRRVTRRGTPDVPRMIRRNMRHDANLIELAWKSKRVDEPRVFAVCDVSGSVAQYARFMLMFLFSLEDVLPRVRAFVFCSDLAEVTGLFKQHGPQEAVARTLAEHGQSSTDYGQALGDFDRLALDDLDRRSTVLILGDARNNDGDPRTDLLRKVFDRSRRVIWLNPEPRVSWDTGDSVISRYRAHCHQVRECGSLAQLERVVSDLLRAVR